MIARQSSFTPADRAKTWAVYTSAQVFLTDLHRTAVLPAITRLNTLMAGMFSTVAEIRSAARYAAHLEPGFFADDISRIAERLWIYIKAYKKAVLIFRPMEQLETVPVLVKYLRPFCRAVNKAIQGNPIPLIHSASGNHYTLENLQAAAEQDIYAAQIASGLIWLKMRTHFHQTYNPLWQRPHSHLWQFRYIQRELANPCNRAEWGEQAEQAYYMLDLAEYRGGMLNFWRKWVIK